MTKKTSGENLTLCVYQLVPPVNLRRKEGTKKFIIHLCNGSKRNSHQK